MKNLTLDPKTTYFRAINRTNILPQPNKPPKIIVRLTSNEQKRALRKRTESFPRYKGQKIYIEENISKEKMNFFFTHDSIAGSIGTNTCGPKTARYS